MATLDFGHSFLSASGNKASGSAPSGGQDELIPFRNSETITLSTAGATTDSDEDLLPANAVVLAVTSTITEALTGAGVAGYTLGDAAVADRFATVTATAAGSTNTGLTAMGGDIAALNAGPSQATAAKLQVTATGGVPTAGAIRVTVFGFYGRPSASV